MTERQQLLFKILVEDYIKTAIPVSSQNILQSCALNISSATIRNDLKNLEDLGLIRQPHTSAGRIPTEDGYRHYIHTHLHIEGLALPVREKNSLKNENNEQSDGDIKLVIKKASSLIGQLVFATFDTDYTYYTGLSYLFNQPEFKEYNLVYQVSQVIDHFDDVLYETIRNHSTKEEVGIFIGSENPFSKECSALITPYHLNQESTLYLGILGPMRMDYAKNISVLHYLKDSLTK